MKLTNDNINGDIVRDTDVYTVIVNASLPHLTLSKTILHSGKHTSGHKHDNLDEIYFFLKGEGQIKLDEKVLDIKANDVILVKGGVFHQVFNQSIYDLEFNCVFQQYRR